MRVSLPQPPLAAEVSIILHCYQLVGRFCPRLDQSTALLVIFWGRCGGPPSTKYAPDRPTPHRCSPPPPPPSSPSSRPACLCVSVARLAVARFTNVFTPPSPSTPVFHKQRKGSAAAGSRQGAAAATGRLQSTASAAPSRDRKELTQKQRELLTKMRTSRSSVGERGGVGRGGGTA